ncbi:MAG TPA: glycoside hydrolase family 5 protein [Pilimelia sp.]|nr:glycoside hydrolase family 5 protein [Pilimelia sp.]
MIKKLSIAAAALLTVVAGVAVTVQQASAATGFYVSNGRLLDANNQDFVMRGINHAHTWYTGQTSAFRNIKATGANTIRVVLSATNTTLADARNVVSLCKTNKLVCVMEVHTTTGYGDNASAITLSQAADYWIKIKSAVVGQERYVIVNIGNEPIGNNNASRWTGDTRGAISKLRSNGFTHTLMVDGPNWGQDHSNTMRNNAASILASDPNRNVIFSVHMYGVYGTASKIRDYLNYYTSRKLPILVGEFGNNHSDGDVDEATIFSHCQSNRIGYIGWSWSGNGSSVRYLDMVNSWNANSLTSWGQRIINGANGIKATSRQASIY